MSGRAQSNGLGKVHVVLTVAGIVFFLSAAGIVLSYGGFGPLIGGGGAPNNSTASPGTSAIGTSTSQVSTTGAATTATGQTTKPAPTQTTAASTSSGTAKTAKPTQRQTAKQTQTKTAKPTQKQTVKPTQKQTAKQTQTKTAKPTQKRTAKPTQTKTAKPTTGGQATITHYKQEGPRTYTYGKTVWAKVKIHNPTNQQQIYYLGYSVIGPNGKAYDNHHSTDQKVMVLPHGTRTAEVHWNVEQNAPTGKYDVVLALYTDRTPDGRLHHRIDKRTVKGAFRLTGSSSASTQGTNSTNTASPTTRG